MCLGACNLETRGVFPWVRVGFGMWSGRMARGTRILKTCETLCVNSLNQSGWLSRPPYPSDNAGNVSLIVWADLGSMVELTAQVFRYSASGFRWLQQYGT